MTQKQYARKYGATVIVGFAIDYVVTMAIAGLWHVRLEFAATCGFVMGLLANYLLFELWVFRNGQANLSAGRLLATAASASIAFACRVIVIWMLGSALGASFMAINLTYFIAAALSMFVNFVLVRTVFS